MLTAALLLASCQSDPRAFGEAVVVVTTDASVPRFVGKVLVQLHAEDGSLRDSREIVTPSPLDWPLSFSVLSESDDVVRTALVRIRAYPDGLERDARPPEQDDGVPWGEPATYDTLGEVCANAPVLPIGTSMTLRRGPVSVTTVASFEPTPGNKTCDNVTRSGSVAARVVITEPGTYQFEIEAASPDGSRGQLGGDTTLSLRRDCLSVGTQFACADDISSENKLSRLVTDLVPGTYWVITGGADPAPADLTLRFEQKDAFQPDDDGLSPGSASNPDRGAVPREPEPGVTIDRLIAILLEPGKRGTVSVTLRAECFGTPADLSRRTGCVDRAGATERGGASAVSEAIDRRAPDLVGTWHGERRQECTGTPQARGAFHEEEVCVRGGAFVRGDERALGDGDTQTRPMRVRVVEPFFLDRFEFTVGRYREALRRGFVSPDDTPRVNNGPLIDDRCTFSAGTSSDVPSPNAGDREGYPLNCVTWATARAICNFIGSDLPSEEQTEFASTASGKSFETVYPWGDVLPTCDRAVIGRKILNRPADDVCAVPFSGPVAVDARPWAEGDVTADGVVGLAGNVQEWQRDGFLSYRHPAWMKAGLRGPAPAQTRAPLRATRGSDWAGSLVTAVGSTRRAEPALARYDNLGFRCSREAR